MHALHKTKYLNICICITKVGLEIDRTRASFRVWRSAALFYLLPRVSLFLAFCFRACQRQSSERSRGYKPAGWWCKGTHPGENGRWGDTVRDAGAAGAGGDGMITGTQSVKERMNWDSGHKSRSAEAWLQHTVNKRIAGKGAGNRSALLSCPENARGRHQATDQEIRTGSKARPKKGYQPLDTGSGISGIAAGSWLTRVGAGWREIKNSI